MSERYGAAVDRRGRLVLQGFVHEVIVKPEKSQYDPLSLVIRRGPEHTLALLSQEHIDALYEYLAPYVSGAEQPN